MTATTKPTNSGGLSISPPDAAERLAYVTLALIPGLGARGAANLLSTFGSAAQVLAASRNELLTVERIGLPLAAAIASPPWKEAEALHARAGEYGQRTLVPCDPSYPSALRTIPDPPLLLFARGDLGALDGECVAIIGSRAHSAYGAEVARVMAEAAAGAGITVVSGMARGLDAIAQASALDAGGKSIGVLGTGADIIYPRDNTALFNRMSHEGLLLTEHPPGERSFRGAFPRRNRLISGLARAVVVVEAAESSGTLVTVSCALEQGREILVVPGPISSATSVATNRLLRDGATPLLGPEDLLAVFGVATPVTDVAKPKPIPGDLSPVEAQALGALSATARSVDEIALAAGLPIGLLLSTLLGLELAGLAEQVRDGGYRRR
jgi:DNA processing protein